MKQAQRGVTNAIKAMTPAIVPPTIAPVLMAPEGLVPEGVVPEGVVLEVVAPKGVVVDASVRKKRSIESLLVSL